MPGLAYLRAPRPDRFAPDAKLPTMKAVITTGNGGYDTLSYRDVPIPVPRTGEVLLRVLAAGVNNTDINTRLGWYSTSVARGTNATNDAVEPDESCPPDEKEAPPARHDGGWNGGTPFPLIQGTDCCGEVLDCGTGAPDSLRGKRVLVRACMRLNGFDSPETLWMASDFDGAFAQYVRVPASEVFVVDSSWSDRELATIPCAYGTAENMMHRAGVVATDRVLVTGASGGVGSAAVQLAKRRGAHVTAIAGQAKLRCLLELGADRVVAREADWLAALRDTRFSVIVDNVAGDDFSARLKTLARGGRYVSSGAIAGPIVSMDWRDAYLNDLTLIGCTAWDEPVFPNLVGYIERDEIRPLLAGEFALPDIARAQREFMRKAHFGNFVLTPPR